MSGHKKSAQVAILQRYDRAARGSSQSALKRIDSDAVRLHSKPSIETKPTKQSAKLGATFSARRSIDTQRPRRLTGPLHVARPQCRSRYAAAAEEENRLLLGIDLRPKAKSKIVSNTGRSPAPCRRIVSLSRSHPSAPCKNARHSYGPLLASTHRR